MIERGCTFVVAFTLIIAHHTYSSEMIWDAHVSYPHFANPYYMPSCGIYSPEPWMSFYHLLVITVFSSFSQKCFDIIQLPVFEYAFPERD